MFQRPNAPTTVANPIPDQTATAGGWFSYTLPADTFVDPDGEPLNYTASYTSPHSGISPPEWLSFTASTRTFSGKAWPNGHLRVTVTATDPGGGSASDQFDIVVSAATTVTPPTSGALVSNMKGSVPDLDSYNDFLGGLVVQGDPISDPILSEFALRFHTGSHALGYAISELKLHFVRPLPENINSDLQVYSDSLMVSVYSVSGDIPGTEIFVFTPPYPLRDGVKTFTAPANAPPLEPDTDYFIVFEATGPFATNSYIEMYTTTSDNEDGLTGWNIANRMLLRDAGDNWDSSSDGRQEDVIKIALRGTVVPSSDATLSELELTDTDQQRD